MRTKNEIKLNLETWKQLLNHTHKSVLFLIYPIQYEIYKHKKALINKEYRKIGDQHG
jgi:hypothetical protein